jgi:amino acid adenylation domain-containing protein/thioester reductase-like protein
MKTTNVADVYELTPLQQGLLFHCLQAPSAGYYIEQMHFTMRGELRVDVIREVWQRIIARHPGLRTSFSWEDINRPVQIVHTRAALPLDEVDLSGVPADEREQRFAEHLLAERRQGFDLESAPLLKLTVCRLDTDTFRLAWRFSHLVMDGWSFGLIMSDFVTLYKALYHGKEVELPRPAGPSGYVGWWRGQEPAEHRDYWQDMLRGYVPPSPLDLGDTAAPTTETIRHGHVQLALGPLADRLRTLAMERGLTLNTLVQGAWTLVLSRCYGSDDVVVGATMSHRPPDLAGVDSIVGPLIVTLPIRSTVDDTVPAQEWLHRLQAAIVGAREHAGAPLPVIRGWHPTPRPGELFETIVSYENVPIPDISFADERLELLGFDVDGRPQYPMSLIVLPGDEIPLRLIHDRQRFTAESADRMLARVRRVLESFVDQPDAAMGELDVLPLQEREAVLARLHRTASVPIGRSLPSVLREHARRDPDRIAVTGADRSLSYAELVAAADRVGKALRANGVRHGDRVGVCAERTPSLVVGVLGVLACGAVYVPLDPANPADRVRFVLRDSSAVAVVAESATLDVVGDPALPTVLLADDLTEYDAAEPLSDDTGPDDVAYLMYTSGSTGQPKGVLVTHRNVLRLVAAARPELDLRADDVWSMFFSPAFDGSTWEMWGALTQGARLVVVPYWVSRSPEELVALLARERVTVCTQTPTAFGQLADADAALSPDLALRVVVLGGEKVDPAALRGWFDRHGDEPWIVNAYGPTEATVWVCHHRLRGAETTAEHARSLIGRPLPDTGIDLVDSAHRLVPLGTPGEMWLAGPGVAAGYHDRPELTGERFAADPFGADGGRRYATGDLARLTPHGELEYLGRIDTQVKVRGFRVELGEIEHRLRAHPAVRDAVAAVRHGELLVAFVVPTDAERPPDATELREHCAGTLPEYMVPATVGTVAELPLTASGKVDRDALSDIGRPRGTGSFVAPRDATERRLAGIFADLLGVERVGVDDDLQELGLHSLLATRAVNGIRAIWHVNIPLRSLFQAPSVASVAAIVSRGGVPRAESDRPGGLDLAREAVLDDDVVPGSPRDPGPPDHVLVTGATGFPGAYLVAELLRTTAATVHCLVRADDAASGLRRLRDHLASLDLWQEAFADRLTAVPGDLAQPAFGLTTERFEHYADLVDQIYHFGAYVNFLYPYRRLRSVNVQGTKEVIRLAALGRTSVLHHVSSVGIFAARPAADGEFRGAEADLDPAAPTLANGYSETKWVAERLVAIARDRGLPVVIHRLGRVSGDSTSGVWRATHDALPEMLKASAGLGLLPRFDGHVDMVPVDYVAKAMAAIATRPDALGRVFHLVNPCPLRFPDLLAGFELAGYPTDAAEMTQWYGELVARSASSDEDWTVAIALLSEWTQHATTGMRDPRFDSHRTQEFLGDAARCPAVDPSVLAQYLRHLADTGFLRHPADHVEGETAWHATSAVES